MPKAYYEKKSLEELSDYELYYNFKKLENSLLIGESSKFVSYEI